LSHILHNANLFISAARFFSWMSSYFSHSVISTRDIFGHSHFHSRDDPLSVYWKCIPFLIETLLSLKKKKKKRETCLFFLF
jgi:hypothetical protein